jgi:hypothetical protein
MPMAYKIQIFTLEDQSQKEISTPLTTIPHHHQHENNQNSRT